MKYIRILYVEIAALLLVSIVTLFVINGLDLSRSSPCQGSAWEIVPYINRYIGEMCSTPLLIPVVGLYYIISILIVTMSQYLYLKGRRGLYIANVRLFVPILILGLSFIFFWLIGEGRGNALYDFAFHDGFSAAILMVPIGLSSFQFIISVLLLSERE